MPDSLNFEEVILEAAKSIATATKALVKAASENQKELVLLGKVGNNQSYSRDADQWSTGLISAAQMVARATGFLCETANEAVQGICYKNYYIKIAVMLYYTLKLIATIL